MILTAQDWLLKWLLSQINCYCIACQHTINRQLSYPIIREVFVHNLSHFSLLVLQNIWCKKQDDIQHGGLGSQGCTAMFWQGVSWDLKDQEKYKSRVNKVSIKKNWWYGTLNLLTNLIVDIIRPQTANEHIHKWIRERDSP